LPFLFGNEFLAEFVGERPERNHGYRDQQAGSSERSPALF
jgi:hypothetical protein